MVSKMMVSAIAAASIVAVAGVSGGAAARNDANVEAAFAFDHVSCSGAENEIRLVIEGLQDSVGLITVDLYINDNDGFLKRAGRVQQRRAAARAPSTKLCMKAPEEGVYAIAVYHDENANKTFDKGAFGLPAEPWGISNNPKVRFGPPDVSEALFPVTNDGAKILIQLN